MLILNTVALSKVVTDAIQCNDLFSFLEKAYGQYASFHDLQTRSQRDFVILESFLDRFQHVC